MSATNPEHPSPRPAPRLASAPIAWRVIPEDGSSARYGRSIGILGLDHVQLAAPPGCEAEARRFYGDVLGLPEVAKPEPLRARGGVWFGVGAQQLHIGVEEGFSPARKAHPALRVADESDLERLAGQLAALGAKVAWDDSLPAVRRFYSEDPWGNRLELLADV